MVIYGHISPYMAIYGPYMAIYGHIWPYMDIYETLNALRVEKLNEHLLDLFGGKDTYTSI